MCFDSKNGAKKVFNNEDEFGMILNKELKEVGSQGDKEEKMDSFSLWSVFQEVVE